MPTTLTHWNYFLSLEKDLQELSFFIEFSEDNLKTYSTKLSSLFLSCSSEVDVVAKLLCKRLDNKTPRNISEYKKTIIHHLPDITQDKVFLRQYSLSLTPWRDWEQEPSTQWWSSYNKVKHKRDCHFNEANLGNVLSSICGLFILEIYYYSRILSDAEPLSFPETTLKLVPEPTLLSLDEKHYTNLVDVFNSAMH